MRLPANSRRVPILRSSRNATSSAVVNGASGPIVMTKPNQLGSLPSVARGSSRCGSPSSPSRSRRQLCRRAAQNSSSRFNWLRPSAAWMSVAFRLYPTCEKMYLWS